MNDSAGQVEPCTATPVLNVRFLDRCKGEEPTHVVMVGGLGWEAGDYQHVTYYTLNIV